MVTKIEVYLEKKEDFYSHFNSLKLSRDLSEYMLEECYGEDVRNEILVVIHHKFLLKDKEKESMIDVLRKNYGMKVQDEEYYFLRNKGMEIILFGGGVLFLLVYYLFKAVDFISEFVLILGWLAIWESVYSILFSGRQKKLYIKRLKKFTKAKIEFKQI